MTAVTTLDAFRDCEGALRNPDLKQALYDAGEVVMGGVLLTLHGKRPTPERVRNGRGNAGRAHEWLLPVPALRRAELKLDAARPEIKLRPDGEVRHNVVERLGLVEVSKPRRSKQQV